jgi:hypothetical protein
MANLAFTSPGYIDNGTCAQSLGNHVSGFRNCGRTASVKATIVGDNRVLSFCGTHAKAPNVTVLETLNTRPIRTAKAVNICCATQHTITFHPVPDAGIISAVKASIIYCEERIKQIDHHGKSAGWRKAEDRLRDVATVELLCRDLGITRKDLN